MNVRHLEVGTNVVKHLINDFVEMKKEVFKEKVKVACKQRAFQYLLKQKESLSKGSNLHYDKFEIQQYLDSDKIDTASAKFYFKMRVRNLGKNL